MSKTKSLALILGVFIMSFLVGYLVLAWTEPTAAPPGANVPTPINVGSAEQWKAGELGIGFSTPPFDISSGGIAAKVFYDADNSSWYVNPSGISVFSGNVGIGTTSPGTRLDVDGGAITARYGLHIDTAVNAGAFQDDDLFRITSFDNDGGAPQIIMRVTDENARDYFKLTRTTNADPPETELYIRGNVGIGATSPGYKLDVNGDINIAGTSVYRRGGTAGVSSTCPAGQSFSGLTVSGGILTSAGSCTDIGGAAAGLWTDAGTYIYPNNYTNLAITDTGNVGIGTTSPGEKLHVYGGKIYVSDAGANTGIQMAGSWIGDHYDGILHIRSGGSVVAFDGGDGVGIGTTSPGAKLDVNADSTTWGGWYEAIRFSQSAHSAITHPGGGLLLGLHGNRRFYFADTSEGQYIMTIDANPAGGGNVGIGTASPGYKLTIVGDTPLYLDPSDDEYLIYDADGRLRVYHSEASTGEVRVGAAWNKPGVYASGPLYLFSDTTGVYIGDSNSEKMFVRADGNVGIGTTSPGEKLTVAGTARLGSDGSQVYIGGNRTGAFLRLNDDSWLYDPQNGWIYVRNGGDTGDGKWRFGELEATGNVTVGGNIFGRMSCYALKIECHGSCMTIGGTIDDKCILGVGPDYRAMAVACKDVEDDLPWWPNTNCGGTCEAIPLSGSIALGDICDDSDGWDIVVTCCALK